MEEKKAVGAKVEVERDPPSPKQGRAKLSVTQLGLGRKLEWKPVSRAKRPDAFVRRRGALARDDAQRSCRPEFAHDDATQDAGNAHAYVLLQRVTLSDRFSFHPGKAASPSPSM